MEVKRRFTGLEGSPLPKKFASSSFVCDVVHADGDCDVDEDTAVVCLSQNVRKLSDYQAKGKDCLLANEKVGAHLWKGVLLMDFMDTVAGKVLHEDTRYLVVYEAFKVLEQDFSNILAVYGAMKEYEVLVTNESPFRYFVFICVVHYVVV
jgi:hypothetical protein